MKEFLVSTKIMKRAESIQGNYNNTSDFQDVFTDSISMNFTIGTFPHLLNTSTSTSIPALISSTQSFVAYRG